MQYQPRIVDSKIDKKLTSSGAIILQGPKWCGKTTTGEHHSKSVIFLDDPDKRLQYELWASTQISLLLEGETPRLIDEWEIQPQIWDAVRHTVDRRRLPGQFILTGSAKPVDRSQIYHSGAGRFSWIKMRPMSLFESHDSNGKVSIKKLFENPDGEYGCINDVGLQDVAFWACRGGWPSTLNLNNESSLEVARDYVEAIINEDISRVDNVNRNIQLSRALMRAYARFQGTQTPITTITADLNASDTKSEEQTIRSYLTALRNLFVIEDMPAWNPNLKSKTAIRTTDTRYFVDPSIAAASLQIGPGDLLTDLKTFGFIFETLCVRDLRIYCEALDGDLFHYRDKNGLECDCVMHLHNGKYALIEIKLGGERLIEDGVKNLLRLEENINKDNMGAPSFKMVVVGAGAGAYQRKDGVWVVPVSCLRD